MKQRRPARARTSNSATSAPPSTVADYLRNAAPKARVVLQKIRALIRDEAPDAEERISYRMPAFFRNGVIVYIAAFTHHIGIFPPVHGSAALDKALATYRGPKGNLRFPLDEPMPYPLIRRVVRARLKSLRAKPAATKHR